MARPKAANWVAEATTTSGTGDITLAGPLEGFAQFKVMADGLIYYTLQDGVDKECGIGTLKESGTKISRDQVLASFVGGVYAAPGQNLDLSGYAECYCTVNADLFNSMNDALAKLDGIENGATADQNANEVPAGQNWLFKSANVQSQLLEAADDIALYSAGATQGNDPDKFVLLQAGKIFNGSVGFVNPADMSVYRTVAPVSGTIVSFTFPTPDSASIVTTSPTATIKAARSIMATQDWVNGRESKVQTINAGAAVTIASDQAFTFDITLNQANTSLGLTANGETVNTQREIIVILRQGTGANKVSWPTNIDWSYDSEPVLAFQQVKYDKFQLVKIHGQANWSGSVIGGHYG